MEQRKGNWRDIDWRDGERTEGVDNSGGGVQLTPTTCHGKMAQHLLIKGLPARAMQRQDHYGKKLIDSKLQAGTHLPCRNCTVRSPHKGPLKNPLI